MSILVPRILVATAVLQGLLATTASAFSITVDPAAYLGSFTVLRSDLVAAGPSGALLYELSPGVYHIDVGSVGHQTRKSFEVLSDGSVAYVASNDSSGSLDLAGSTVTFRNATVDFDPRLYPGPIWISGVTGTTFEIPSSVVLVPDNDYAVRLPLIAFTNAYFHVDVNGNVGSATPASANPIFVPGDRAFDFDNESTPNSVIRLKNTTVRIDPVDYSGSYLISLVTAGAVRGVSDLTLIPAFDFRVKLSSLDAAGAFFFQVNEDGSLGFVPNHEAFGQVVLDNSAAVPAVRFRNAAVHFEPGRFAGGYHLDFSQPVPGEWLYGPHTVTLVPDTRYAMTVGGETWVAYALDVNGELGPWTCCGSDAEFTDRSGSFDFDGDTLRFRNTDVRVTPSDDSAYSIRNEVFAPLGTTGAHVISVLPDMSYGLLDLDASATGNFKVLSPCEIDPPGGISVGATAYEITCVPRAHAGDDQIVDEEVPVLLDGTASEFPANATPEYSWAQIAGPAVALDDSGVPQPSFVAPAIDAVDGSQTLTFSLTVGDGLHESEADTVDVTVLHVNKAPVADAGDDLQVREGATVALDGNHSYDPDGDAIVDYSWSQTGGTPVALQPDDASVTPEFQAPLADGTPLLFQLMVSDGELDNVPSVGTDPEASDTVQVLVGANTAPNADAGADQTRDEGATVALDGTGSADSDGDGLVFQWSQLAGTAVVLDDPASPTPVFTAPTVGAGGETLVFALTVTDDYAYNPKTSATDTVRIHVRNVNDPPVCHLAVASPNRLWPPNHKMFEIAIHGLSDPNAGDSVMVDITGVLQDEPVNGLGDGDTGPDAVVQIASDGSETLLLRAERAGDGNGRVYLISFSASDGEASCNGSVIVEVPHDRNGVAIDDGASFESTPP